MNQCLLCIRLIPSTRLDLKLNIMKRHQRQKLFLWKHNFMVTSAKICSLVICVVDWKNPKRWKSIKNVRHVRRMYVVSLIRESSVRFEMSRISRWVTPSGHTRAVRFEPQKSKPVLVLVSHKIKSYEQIPRTIYFVRRCCGANYKQP